MSRYSTVDGGFDPWRPAASAAFKTKFPDTVPEVGGYAMDPRMPVHQLAFKRITNERDLFIVITAKDSHRGVGKTTFALFLAMSWTRLFTSHDWRVDPDEPVNGMASYDSDEFFEIIKKVGDEYDSGTVVFRDEAQEFSGRRAMKEENVEFISRAQMYRRKQPITILALPDPGSLDPGIERLADVWINVTRPGAAVIHKMGVQSYGSRNITQRRVYRHEFPDVSDHHKMDKLDAMKDAKMEEWDEEQTDEDDGGGQDGEMPLSAQAMLAQDIKEKTGCSWDEVQEKDDRLTYSGSYLSRNIPEGYTEVSV